VVLGTLGLSGSVIAGGWFKARLHLPPAIESLIGPQRLDVVGDDAWSFGWFGVLLVALACVAGALLSARLLTARTTERVMLQAPFTYAAALVAFLVLAARTLLWRPDGGAREVVEQLRGLVPLPGFAPPDPEILVTTTGWVALASCFVLLIGTWYEMHDEGTEWPEAKAQAEALLADVPVRSASPASEAPTAPTTPSTTVPEHSA